MYSGCNDGLWAKLFICWITIHQLKFFHIGDRKIGMVELKLRIL